jgi:hypothetical protein
MSQARHERHLPSLHPAMSLISVKGALTGALMATAGTLVVSTTPAQAAACAPAATTLGSLVTPCDLDGFSFQVDSFSNPNTAILVSGGFFGVSQIGTGGGGSFDFTVSAAPGRFFTTSSFFLGSNAATVTTPFFTFNTNGDAFAFPDASVTSISGTYSFAGTPPNSVSSLTFTTDVPVPLPVVGAGLAFGFTRNLRKRAKSVA